MKQTGGPKENQTSWSGESRVAIPDDRGAFNLWRLRKLAVAEV